MGAPALRLRVGRRVGMGSGLLCSAFLMTGQARAASDDGGWRQSGQASWYGGQHAGRRTSSGTIFNPTEMTAAHPSLPLGSRIRVTMRDTGDSVVVTVTDRQPDHGHRIIDLSRGAAERIGLASRGVGEVVLEPAGRVEPVEVADATDEAVDLAPGDAAAGDLEGAAIPARRGRRHTRHAGQGASAGRPYYPVRFAAQVRSSAPHRAAQHRL
ncbi:MAG: septal ring lytic transglycosylase RlpA family protein [Janthinobacterium lividum]